MSNEQFDLPTDSELRDFDRVEVDQADRDLLEAQIERLDADATRTEDLSTTDLLNDGALPEDLEQSNIGRREAEADMMDPAHDDTIDERIRQEQPEEGPSGGGW